MALSCGYLNGVINNRSGDTLTFVTSKNWSGQPSEYPDKIRNQHPGHFTGTGSPNELDGPTAAVVYRVQIRDGVKPFDWLISWMVETSDQKKNKVYTEFRDAGGFGKDWSKILEQNLAPANEQSQAEREDQFTGNVFIDNNPTYPSLKATISLISAAAVQQ